MVKHLQAEFFVFNFNTSLIYFSHCSPCLWQRKRTETQCIHSQVARRLDLADKAVFALQLYQIEPPWQQPCLASLSKFSCVHSVGFSASTRNSEGKTSDWVFLVRQSGARASGVNAKWPDGVVFCEAKHLQRQTRRLQCQVKAASRPEKPTVCIKSSAEPWDCVSGSALFGQQQGDDLRYKCYLGLVRPSYQTPVGNIFNQATAARSKKRHRKLCFIFALHPTSFFKRLHDVHQEEA